MGWRKNLNKSIRPYIEKLVKESFLYSKEYATAENKGKAQLWVALALLSKQLSEIESKLRLFEAVLKDISPKKALKIQELEKTKAVKDEVEKIFKNILQGKPITPTPIPKKKMAKVSKRKKRK